MINKLNLTQLASTFVGVFLLIAAFNLFTFFSAEGCRQIGYCSYRVGFPFALYNGGGTTHLNNYVWQGITGNLAFLIAVWALVALAAQHRHKLR